MRQVRGRLLRLVVGKAWRGCYVRLGSIAEVLPARHALRSYPARHALRSLSFRGCAEGLTLLEIDPESETSVYVWSHCFTLRGLQTCCMDTHESDSSVPRHVTALVPDSLLAKHSL